jgi:hypothetical protein
MLSLIQAFPFVTRRGRKPQAGYARPPYIFS